MFSTDPSSSMKPWRQLILGIDPSFSLPKLLASVLSWGNALLLGWIHCSEETCYWAWGLILLKDPYFMNLSGKESNWLAILNDLLFAFWQIPVDSCLGWTIKSTGNSHIFNQSYYQVAVCLALIPYSPLPLPCPLAEGLFCHKMTKKSGCQRLKKQQQSPR